MIIKTYQIWIHGNILVGHVQASSKTKALMFAKEIVRAYYPDDKRPCVSVCPISPDYYTKLAEMNRRAGFGLEAGD